MNRPNSDEYSLHRVLRILGAAVGSILFLAEPAFAQLSYDDWTEQSLDALEESPQAERYQRSVVRARAAIREARRQSPWETSTTLHGRKREERPDLRTNVPFVEWEMLARSETRFDHRSGFQSILNGTLRYNLLQESVEDEDGNEEETGLPYDASLEFNYDVLRGGADGLRETREDIQVLQAKRQWSRSAEQWLQTRLEFLQVVTGLYRTSCALQILDGADEEIQPRVEQARAKAEANQISETDFLNFLDLKRQIRQRNASRESEHQELVGQLRTWGDAPTETILDLAEQRDFVCSTDAAPVEGSLEDRLWSDTKLEEVATALPSRTSARYELRRSVKEVRFRELQNRPGLRPFVRGGLNREPRLAPDEQSYWEVLAGARLNWELPFRQGVAGVETRERGTAEARARVDATQQRQLSQLESLQRTIRSQDEVLTVLRNSLATSEKLLSALRAQETAGVVDSLNFANAYLNYLRAQISVVESWTRINGALRRLEEYERWSEETIPLVEEE